MATTEHFYTGNGSTTTFAFTFPYLANVDVKVELDNVLKTENSSGQTNNDYTISNTNIVFNSAPGSGVNVHIYRNTNVDTPQATYAAGSSIRAVDLNNNQTQVLYSTQEAQSQQIRTTDIKDGAVNSTKIENNTIVNADINSSAAIDGSKIQASSGSNSGTMSAANFTKLGGIETGATADQTAAEIRTLVESASDSNVFTDADHTKLNGIETGATADQTVSEIKTLIAGSPLSNTHIAADADIAHSKLADVTSSQVLIGNASNVPTATSLSGDVTLNNAGVVTIANDAVEIGMIGCEQTTITDSDSHLPTSGAVVDYVSSQLAPIGGLEVIANEVSFPNTQPAAGVVISITDAGGVVFNGSGSSTTGRTLGGATVTINNAPTALNSETLVSGAGLMVSSTGSSNIYNYHKLFVKESDVVQLSDDINDFNSRYRIAASAPTSNNDEGDLYFDTGANKMFVYDGSAWGQVTSTGEFKILGIKDNGQAHNGSGPTFNGSNDRFDLFESASAADLSQASQLLVVLNGVIQKPNDGSFSGTEEGYYLDGTNGIRFCDPPASGSSLFITKQGSATQINTPADNTITQAKIAGDAVDEQRLQVSNAPTNGYYLQAQSGNTGGLTWAAVPNPDLTQLSASNLTSGTIPDARFPSTLPAVSGANLTGLPPSCTGGGSDEIFWENGQTVTTNYTISNNKNAMSAGPITINNGIAVTIGTGENWTIV